MDHALGCEVVELMFWDDFVTMFMAEFAPVIEVKQFTREF